MTERESLNCTRLELKEGIPLLGVMYSDTI